jgi:hypothetical protein
LRALVRSSAVGRLWGADGVEAGVAEHVGDDDKVGAAAGWGVVAKVCCPTWGGDGVVDRGRARLAAVTRWPQ